MREEEVKKVIVTSNKQLLISISLDLKVGVMEIYLRKIKMPLIKVIIIKYLSKIRNQSKITLTFSSIELMKL